MTDQRPYSHSFPSPTARVARCGARVADDAPGGTVTCPRCLDISEQLRGSHDPIADNRVRGTRQERNRP